MDFLYPSRVTISQDSGKYSVPFTRLPADKSTAWNISVFAFADGYRLLNVLGLCTVQLFICELIQIFFLCIISVR